MSGTDRAAWLESADAVRRHNRELDERLLALLRDLPGDRLHEPLGDGEWTLAENAGHIAEFPRYFARQLREWIRGERVVIGRVAEHDADRNDAVVRAPQRGVDELVAGAEASFAELAEVLEELTDEHLTATTRNVKYGDEPLHAYLQRYVVGHKEAHLDQLERALAAVGGGAS